MRKLDDDGMRNLLIAIVEQAVKDYSNKNPGVRFHASQFINSSFSRIFATSLVWILQL